MTELAAAAELVRRIEPDRDCHPEAYGYWEIDALRTLAAEYLALVRPDDATPLNTAAAFDWLDKLKPATGDLSMLCVRMCDDGLHLVVNDYVCPSVATKGVVRSLLTSVLGIPLTGDVQ